MLVRIMARQAVYLTVDFAMRHVDPALRLKQVNEMIVWLLSTLETLACSKAYIFTSECIDAGLKEMKLLYQSARRAKTFSQLRKSLDMKKEIEEFAAAATRAQGLDLPPVEPDGFSRDGSTAPLTAMAAVVTAAAASTAPDLLAQLRAALGADVYKDIDRCAAAGSDNALASAVRAANTGAVELLLALSANPNQAGCCSEGLTPLQLAVSCVRAMPALHSTGSDAATVRLHSRYAAVVAHLLAAGADPRTGLPGGIALVGALPAEFHGHYLPFLLHEAMEVPCETRNVPIMRPLHFALVGQRSAKALMVHAVETHYAGLPRAASAAGARKPLVLLVTGPTGCGKSRLVKCMADTLLRAGEGIAHKGLGGEQGVGE